MQACRAVHVHVNVGGAEKAQFLIRDTSLQALSWVGRPMKDSGVSIRFKIPGCKEVYYFLIYKKFCLVPLGPKMLRSALGPPIVEVVDL